MYQSATGTHARHFLAPHPLDDSEEGHHTLSRFPLSDLNSSGRDAASITLLLNKLAIARFVVKTFNDDKTKIEAANEGNSPVKCRNVYGISSLKSL